jgi:NAD(P)-dependent dehydrogenase (short-subunit alcohol dehydrogenase family)
MDLELSGKRAIVTGGSKGIGLAIGRALAAEGADVALVARDSATLEAARETVASQAGGKVIAVAADTGSDADVRRMVAAVVAGLGGADILVNCAARPNTGAVYGLDDFDEQDFNDHLNVKLLGALRTARAVAPLMRENGWGRIINISGLAARATGSVTGAVRNIAVAAMTKNLADELGKDGINVTVVHPGMTVTERIPGLVADRAKALGVSEDEVRRKLDAGTAIGRLVTAEEVADVVAFLASPKSVGINGDAIPVGGGVPGSVYY